MGEAAGNNSGERLVGSDSGHEPVAESLTSAVQRLAEKVAARQGPPATDAFNNGSPKRRRRLGGEGASELNFGTNFDATAGGPAGSGRAWMRPVYVETVLDDAGPNDAAVLLPPTTLQSTLFEEVPLPDSLPEAHAGTDRVGDLDGDAPTGPSYEYVADPRQPAEADTEVSACALDPTKTFDRFVVGDSNRLAYAAALAVAEETVTGKTPSRTPLFIYGSTSSGTTHLMQAIAHQVTQERSDLKIVYVSTEALLNEFIEGIRTNKTSEFKTRYRSCDLLLIDHISIVASKEKFGEELFHMLDYLLESGAQVVFGSDRSPKEIVGVGVDDRLRSRMLKGLVAPIEPAEYETRLAIARQSAHESGITVPESLLTEMARRTKTGFMAAKLAVSLCAHVTLLKLTDRDISEELLERVCEPLMEAPDSSHVTPKTILELVADEYGLSIDDLRGKSRSRPLVTARQIAMYVMRELTDFSYPAIGREFGDRDHSTVMHGVTKISKLLAERRAVYDQVVGLMARLPQQSAQRRKLEPLVANVVTPEKVTANPAAIARSASSKPPQSSTTTGHGETTEQITAAYRLALARLGVSQETVSENVAGAHQTLLPEPEQTRATHETGSPKVETKTVSTPAIEVKADTVDLDLTEETLGDRVDDAVVEDEADLAIAASERPAEDRVRADEQEVELQPGEVPLTSWGLSLIVDRRGTRRGLILDGESLRGQTALVRETLAYLAEAGGNLSMQDLLARLQQIPSFSGLDMARLRRDGVTEARRVLEKSYIKDKLSTEVTGDTEYVLLRLS